MCSVGHAATDVTVHPVTEDNWRDVRDLTVAPSQRAFVEDSNSYLALCCSTDWNPCAVSVADDVIGFMMWAIDDDDSVWLGGIFIDTRQQRRGYGRRCVEVLVGQLAEQAGEAGFALSYQRENSVAARLYLQLGFVETGEMVDGEVVARRRPA
jgi:diamine N-acetyltransferase